MQPALGQSRFVSNVDEDGEEGGNSDGHGDNEGEGDKGKRQR